MSTEKKLSISLLFMRVTVLLVLLVWTLDKFLKPEHAAKVFEKFYSMPALGHLVVNAIGAAELVLLVLFFIGFKKKITYGIVLIIHGASTFSSFAQYLSPFEGNHLLFFAAWPMFAACLALFLLRDQDNLLQIDSKYA